MIMTKRQFALLILIALAWSAIGDRPRGGSLLAQSGRAPGAPVQQQAVPASIPMTFEYRILYGTISKLSSLETAVNQLTQQGYIVDNFQTVSRINGGYPGLWSMDSSGRATPLRPFEGTSETEMIVLLKRARK